MNVVFYISAIVAIIATFLVITRANPMHALLYLILSLLAVSIVFYTLGAPFIAALEVIVYAGAIMVLFIFAIMLLNQGTEVTDNSFRRVWAEWRDDRPVLNWILPALFALILLAEVIYILAARVPPGAPTALYAPVGVPIEPELVGATLFTTYLIGVELSSILLLAGLVGAYHLGRQRQVSRLLRREQAEITPSKEFYGEAAGTGAPQPSPSSPKET